MNVLQHWITNTMPQLSAFNRAAFLFVPEEYLLVGLAIDDIINLINMQTFDLEAFFKRRNPQSTSRREAESRLEDFCETLAQHYAFEGRIITTGRLRIDLNGHELVYWRHWTHAATTTLAQFVFGAPPIIYPGQDFRVCDQSDYGGLDIGDQNYEPHIIAPPITLTVPYESGLSKLRTPTRLLSKYLPGLPIHQRVLNTQTSLESDSRILR